MENSIHCKFIFLRVNAVANTRILKYPRSPKINRNILKIRTGGISTVGVKVITYINIKEYMFNPSLNISTHSLYFSKKFITNLFPPKSI